MNQARFRAYVDELRDRTDQSSESITEIEQVKLVETTRASSQKSVCSTSGLQRAACMVWRDRL